MLKVSGLSCAADNRTLFSNLTFSVFSGSALIISGPNGSGKSSLLKILTGLWQPTEGSVSWQTQKIQAGDPHYLSQLLYIGHKMGIHPALTPLQHLKWLLGIQNASSSLAERQQALQAVGLVGFEDTPCEVLSKGQCQRVALARLWLNPPKCWILDEPFTALDTGGIELVQARFLMHLKQGGLLILAMHHHVALGAFPIQRIRLGILEEETC